MVSDEQFFAWLDGELGHAEAARVTAEVEADPKLSRRADEHRALRRRLNAAFDQVAEAPAPARLHDMIEMGTNVVDLPPAKTASRWSLTQWAAMAATLAVGIVTGTLLAPRGTSPVSVEGGRMYAAAALDGALQTRLASAPGGDIRIGLTFRDDSGTVCRTFMESATSGLACREGQRWHVRGLFGAPEGQGGPYRMAAGMDPSLAALVGSTMAGEPLDAAQEKAARDDGWRPTTSR